MNIKYDFSGWMLRHLPKSLQKYWHKSLEKYFRNKTVSSRENERRLHEFQRKQLRIVSCGFFIILVLLCMAFFSTRDQEELFFTRNSFGKGEKEIQLKVDHKGQKEEIRFELEEQELSLKEEKALYQSFLKDLKKEMAGKNPSLKRVNRSLSFPDPVKGYPFSINYEPEDYAVIDCNGELGIKAKELKEGESISTRIMVQAVYKRYEFNTEISVVIIPLEVKKASFIQKIQQALVVSEANSRAQEKFVLNGSEEGVTFVEKTQLTWWYLPIIGVIVLLLLLMKGYQDLKVEEKIRHQENMEDFPLIVHLLTLYMGAGLSFSSSVDRISEDYETNQRQERKRYAFEQILVMNQCMQMGVRPKEACTEWGARFSEKMYGKFAMLLSQGFCKGAKEIRYMMEKEQQDAFQVQVDYVRRRGEEASTKLIFPMIVLLFMIMVLIMFPAILQFYGT